MNEPLHKVAVLFARQDSIYKTMPECDVWDIQRDARNYRGDLPVVAHPPCRAWGILRHMAKPRPGEKELALLAVNFVRIFGGVLEHPAGSGLWPVGHLPEPGQKDAWGGWTFSAPQQWWGHKAEKNTRFYIVGCEPSELPEIPIQLGEASFIIGTSGRKRNGSRLRPGDNGYRPEISKREREATPDQLAAWLVALATKCKSAKEAFA